MWSSLSWRKYSSQRLRELESDERRRIENVALRGHISKLAALVAHHYRVPRNRIRTSPDFRFMIHAQKTTNHGIEPPIYDPRAFGSP